MNAPRALVPIREGCGYVYRYQHTYSDQRTRIHQPRQITLLLALIVATVVMVLAALSFAILLTGWPLS